MMILSTGGKKQGCLGAQIAVAQQSSSTILDGFWKASLLLGRGRREYFCLSVDFTHILQRLK